MTYVRYREGVIGCLINSGNTSTAAAGSKNEAATTAIPVILVVTEAVIMAVFAPLLELVARQYPKE
jgi:hypothetical protein